MIRTLGLTHLALSVSDLELATEEVGASGGIKHFGFRLADARDIDKAVTAIERAGGKIKHRGNISHFVHL